jgi:metal-dependent amidase/aminoacylase/carboxypeptidase family protein
MEELDLPRTIRLYGTPAEETFIGKVDMRMNGFEPPRRRATKNG